MYFDNIVRQGFLGVRCVCSVVVRGFCSFSISGVSLRTTVFQDGFKMLVVYRKNMYLFYFLYLCPFVFLLVNILQMR